MTEYSLSPDGEKCLLPDAEDYKKEFERLQKLVSDQKSLGREIVVVMGLGFVGAVMAAVVADARDKSGQPNKFVIRNATSKSKSLSSDIWKRPMVLITCKIIRNQSLSFRFSLQVIFYACCKRCKFKGGNGFFSNRPEGQSSTGLPVGIYVTVSKSLF